LTQLPLLSSALCASTRDGIRIWPVSVSLGLSPPPDASLAPAQIVENKQVMGDSIAEANWALTGVYYAAGADIKYQVHMKITPRREPCARTRLMNSSGTARARCGLQVWLFSEVDLALTSRDGGGWVGGQVLQAVPAAAAIKLTTKVDNVAGVKIPVFQVPRLLFANTRIRTHTHAHTHTHTHTCTPPPPFPHSQDLRASRSRS
jgi:hypothetical protein